MTKGLSWKWSFEKSNRWKKLGIEFDDGTGVNKTREEENRDEIGD